MSSATYALRRNQNIARPTTDLRMGPVSLSFIVIGIIAVLALLYLGQVTKLGAFGYKVSELQQQRDQLIQSKQDLEVEAARLSSIQQVEASKAAGQMVAEQQVSYAR